ncbi:MAG: WD40 repeat domain-containing protein [Bryobacteraceae bacterium]
MDRKIASEAAVSTLVFSTDGALLRGLCQDGKVRAWNVADGAIRQTIAFEQGDTAPSLSPAGLTTVGKDGSLKTWDLGSGKVGRRVPPSGLRIRRLAVSPDGNFFAGNVKQTDMASETSVRVLDASGEERFVVPSGLGGLGGLAISPDGGAVVAASYDADMRAWNARNGELLRLIDELPVSMFDLKFSPDGKWLAAAGADRIAYLYDTKTWKMARKLTGQPEMISALAFSPNGQLLATGGFSELTQKRPVKVIIWEIATGKAVRTVDAPQRVSSIAFSPDGKWTAVSTGGKSIDLWSV